jgi:FHA domain
VALERCINGHLFDPAKHTACPHCGVPGLDISMKTLPKRPPEEGRTQPKGETAADQGDAGPTMPYFQERIGIDPVVGWLVCKDGPSRGMDYRIRSENNSIGRSENMRICIDGDPSISREYHAYISYDPQANIYTLLPGNARGLAYLNKQPVYSPAQLAPFDEILLGKTTLVFVPLCGDFGGRGFRWD